MLLWIAVGVGILVVGIPLGAYLGGKLADLLLDMMGGPYYEHRERQKPSC